MTERLPRTLDEFRAALIGIEHPGRAINSKYDGECGWCGQAIIKGDLVAWLPNDKCVLCVACAIDGTAP